MRLVFRIIPLLALAGGPTRAAGLFLPDFSLSSAAVANACGQAKQKAETRLTELAKIPPESATLKNSLVSFSDIVSDLSDETSVPMFLGQIATDKWVRDAGIACDTDISKYMVGVYAREDLYRVLKAYAAKGEKLGAQETRLLEKTLLDFKRNGLDLPPESRAKVREVKQRIVSIQNDFHKSVAEEKTTVSFAKPQLEGLPDDFIRRLPRNGDQYVVSLDYPDYFPFMDNAKDAEARRALEFRFDNRGGEGNVKLMEEALRLRLEAARLLGYPSHAHYVLEDRMAKTPEEVQKFLQRVIARLREKGLPELAELLKLKREELGDATDGVIRAWDWRYYHNKLLKTRYRVDEQKIKEYFPMETVTSGMLQVYQKLLGLKFREVKPANAWHEDVRLFEVRNADGAEPIAAFYMDLFPREGKYKHAAAFTLVQGRLLPDGSYQRPISAVVANFNKPTTAAPSLLLHDEVETYFHEFGHIMHQVLTRAEYERFSGTSVARDFVEAPSQMLENWVWKESVLRSLSGHYKSPSKKLPPELLKAKLAAKNADSGLIYLRQAFFAELDLRYHLDPPADTTGAYAALMGEISLIPMTPGTHPQASFGHLMNGYDAGYYGYLWSKVYAEEMFSRFEKEGILNPETGLDYRRKILEAGSSIEEGASLRSFLGREPNEKAFLRSIGLQAAPMPR